MTLETLAELTALGLAAWAALRSVPQPVRLDWERLLKVSLSTVLMGDTEAAGGDRAAWEARVTAQVPYHPAARALADKLLRPDPAALPSPALEGERALVEALARCPDAAARWRRMFIEDRLARDVLLSDPAEQGPDYAADRALGQGADWSAVAAWGPAVTDGLQRRFSHIVAVVLCSDPARAGLGAALHAAAGLRCAEVDPATLADQDALLARVAESVAADSDRIVLIAIGEAALVAARLLHASPELRDHTLAVLSLGGALGTTEAARTWMAESFTQEALDTEINRFTYYFSVPVVDTAAVDDAAALAAVDWDGQHWPTPKPSRNTREAVLPVRLGPLPAAWLEQEAERTLLARALWVLLAFVLSQG